MNSAVLHNSPLQPTTKNGPRLSLVDMPQELEIKGNPVRLKQISPHGK